MKIRRFFCAVLTIALILSMTPVAWADTGDAETDSYAVEEQTINAAEYVAIETVVTEAEPDVALPSIEEGTEPTEVTPVVEPDTEAPPAVIAEGTVCDLTTANGYGDLTIETAE